MNRLFFAVLAALILSAPPAATAEERTAAQATEEPAACDDVFLGEYTLTAYCPCARCCGKSDGITATGTLAAEGRTIAVDPRVIPYGAHVLLIWPDGTQRTYIAEDCGSGVTGSRIDVFFSDHQAARVFGVQSAMAYLAKEDAP